MKNIWVIIVALLLGACGNGKSHDTSAHSEHEKHDAEESIKGPHGGRLLSDGDFTLEVAIFERGVPPEFHVYASKAGKPIEPSAVDVQIELTRLGGKVDRFNFTPQKDYLKGAGEVNEPHSFDVNVIANYSGTKHVWKYAAYEGRTTIAAEIATASAIKTAIASPGVLRETLILYGSIRPDAQRVRAVSARFPGPIRAVHKQVGDNVKAGETLAVIESNESLQTYAIAAPIAGVVTSRHANAGETAGAEPLFVIADYSQVWAELNVFARDRSKIKMGQCVVIKATDGDTRGEGVIDFIAAAEASRNQTLVARVQLDNSASQWTSGLYISGSVIVGEAQKPLLVKNSALQTFRDLTVVFAQVGDTYEVRMLELGNSDGEYTEVLSGLDVGTAYVSENSYLIKADIEKSGASHDH